MDTLFASLRPPQDTAPQTLTLMNLSHRIGRVRCLRTALAVLFVFVLGFGLLKNTFLLDGATPCGEIALDIDASDDADVFLSTLEPFGHWYLNLRPKAAVDTIRVHTLNQPPATPPPIMA